MLQNYLSVTSGDFDGDERDEIAVFVPAVKSNGGPRIEIFDFGGSSWTKIQTFSLGNIYSVNMIDILAADINGDGIEDLCYSQGLYNRLLEAWRQPIADFPILDSSITVRYGSRTDALTQTDVSECRISGDDTSAVTRVSLDFGDIDKDGKEELVAAGQKERDENTRWLAAYKYDHEGNQLQMVEDTLITIGSYDVNGQNYNYFSTAGCIADMTCVKSVGSKEDIYCDSILYEYNLGSGFKIKKRFEGSSLTAGSFANDAKAFWWSGTQESPQIWTDIKSDGGNYYYHEWGATAADFNGDGVETIYLEQHFWMDVHSEKMSPYKGISKNETSLVLEEPYYRLTEINPLKTGDGTSVTEGNNSFVYVAPPVTGSYLSNDGHYHSFSFAAPNTDNDSIHLAYKDYYFTYSSPIVMAVLASPPYFSDLLHLDGGDTYVYNSETSFGKTKGSGGSTTQTNTVSVGGMVGFEHEFSIFDVKVASLEIEAEFQSDWTWETEKASMTEYSVTYTTFGGQDSVVLYSIPTDVFVYDAWTPDEDGSGWTTSEMKIQLPYQPVTSVVEVSAYDEIAQQYPNVLPKVGGEILKHTLGQPATYPQGTAGLKDVLIGSEWSGVSGGAGASITQSIDITRENTYTTSYNNSWKLTAGGTLFDVKGSVSAGGEAGGGKSVTDLEGTTFETSVVNMPQEGEDAGYGYNWKLLKYSYEGVQSFPVITYLVNNVTQPSVLSANMTAKGISTGEIELNWEESKTLGGGIDYSVAYYGIYRYYDTIISPGYREIARIPSVTNSSTNGDYTYDPGANQYTATVGGHIFTYDAATGIYSYINGSLSPYTSYRYKLKVISDKAPYESVLSDACEARTFSDIASVTITTPQTITVYPDDTGATVQATVNTQAGAGYKLGEHLYQWQKREKGARGADGSWIVHNWTNMSGKTSDTLTIANPKESDALEYRLIADIFFSPETGGGGQWVGAISEASQLIYSKRTPGLTVTADSSGGSSPAVNLRAEVDKGSGKAAPTGAVAFTITNNGSFTKTVSADVNTGSGLAAVSNIPLPADGIYEISAAYSGDTVYESVKASSEHIALSEGTGGFYFIEMDDNYEYGDTFTPKLYKYLGVDNKQAVSGAVFAVKDNSGWVGGSTVTAGKTGNYTLDACFTVAGGGEKTVSKQFTVSAKEATVIAPTRTVKKGAASPLGRETLSISPALVLADTAESLGFSVQCLNFRNQSVTLDSNTPDGRYTTRVTEDLAPEKTSARSNYKFSFIDGSYTVLPGIAPGITTASLPNGTEGEAYSQTLAATGDTPITWSIESGNLPGGLSLDTGAGAISGTPAATGTFNFTVKAVNTAGSGIKALNIVIGPSAPVTFTITATADSGGSISPNGAVSVTAGGSHTFTITPNPNYGIASVTVDGVNQGDISSYKFTGVSGDHTIRATFIYTGGEDIPGDTPPRTLTDSGTGISVFGNISEDAVLTIRDMTLGSDTASKMIRLWMNDGEHKLLLGVNISVSGSFTGASTISLPVGAQYNGETVTILHAKQDGTLETYTVSVKDGKATFETFDVTSRSPFAVFAVNDAKNGNSGKANTPNTGDQSYAFIWVIMLILSSGTVLTWGAQRKRKVR